MRGLLLEHADELGADDLALGFRFGHVVEQLEEAVGGVHVHEVRVQLVLEHVNHLLALALAHEAVVHVHADELLADGLDQQRRHHRRVHAAGQRQQHLLVADLGADRVHLLVDEGVRQLRGGDSLHVFGALVGVHAGVLLVFGNDLRKLYVKWRGCIGRSFVLSAPCSVSHLVEASVVDAEVVPDLVHDGLPDLLDDLRARAEAALMGTFEHGDHVGDVAVVAVCV